MAAHGKLSDGAVQEQLEAIPGWQVQGGKLHREFKFDDFSTAFGFMASAAIVAEKMDHHPEWSNVYNRVAVDLVTHDAGGITDRDFRLAKAMNRLAGFDGAS